jgi:hypothetical protein
MNACMRTSRAKPIPASRETAAAPDRQQLPFRVQILHLAAVKPLDPPAPGSSTVGSSQWTCACSHTSRGNKNMLWTICIILVVLWVLGMATAYTAGGLLHLLLLVALIVMLFRIVQGRRAV